MTVEADTKELFTEMSFNSWALRVGDDGADSVVVEEMGVETPDCTLAVIFEESRSRELARIMFYARRGRTTKFAQNGVMSARDVDETKSKIDLDFGSARKGIAREEEAAGGRGCGREGGGAFKKYELESAEYTH